MPIPLLESDNLECIHKGKVLLKSSISNLLSINNAGAITLQDLSQANIIGCQNQILGVPTPCTKLIISTPESITSTLLEVNKEKIVLTEYINQVLTDKGSPLSLQESPKAKGLFEIEHNLDSNNPNNTSTESTATNVAVAGQVASIDNTQAYAMLRENTHNPYELQTTHSDHHINCPEVESGNFIRENIKDFSTALHFLEEAISQSNAKLDSNNLKTFEQYNRAEHKQMFANICLSKKIQEIYRRNWLETLLDETKVAYMSDIQFFMTQWKLTMNENHQSITSFVGSFCERVHCTQPQVRVISSMDNTMNLLISNSIIEIKIHYEISLHNKMITDRLLVLLRQWYIIYHSQNNSFPFHLQGYMRYIEINIRYFYDSKLGAYQPIEADLINIKDLNV